MSNKFEHQLFTDEEIRDTNTHNSEADLDNYNTTKRTILVHNGLTAK